MITDSAYYTAEAKELLRIYILAPEYSEKVWLGRWLRYQHLARVYARLQRVAQSKQEN